MNNKKRQNRKAEKTPDDKGKDDESKKDNKQDESVKQNSQEKDKNESDNSTAEIEFYSDEEDDFVSSGSEVDDQEAASDDDDDDSGSDVVDSDSEDDFEDQGSSDDDDDVLEQQQDEDESDEDIAIKYESAPRSWKVVVKPKRSHDGTATTTTTTAAVSSDEASGNKETAAWMHTDDMSSDEEDEQGLQNRIGRVPIHWYDEYEHIGYDGQGKKVAKSASLSDKGDLLDQAIANQENREKGKFVVHDMLNDKDVELTPRQLEIIRRVQAGAFAHPEHNSTPDFVDYYSGVDKQISGLSSDQYEPKRRFQPSQWERMQVNKLLHNLKMGNINMDYLTNKIKDMNETSNKNKTNSDAPFMLWAGDEEDLLNIRKGPQHMAAPKLPPPGHAESYVPPDEYLPSEEEKKQWEDMDAKDRPHGLVVPKKHANLRSLGAYEHSVREAFERCLDLYLCPRSMKRRLNIDPESLVPKLPKASDLRPFPTAKCIEYVVPRSDDSAAVAIRCVTSSPDGQYMANGASDGCVRVWEVQTGRLLQSWNVADIIAKFDENAASNGDAKDDKASGNENENGSKELSNVVVAVEWNPNSSHHCLLASVRNYVVVIATGTANNDDAIMTTAYLSAARKGGNVANPKAQKAVKWIKVAPDKGEASFKMSALDNASGPVCVLKLNENVASICWHTRGDYFVSVAPKAKSAAVLVHQLSKGNSQQPFGKAKNDHLLACFHPNKPFLFVASRQHIRVYNLVKQILVKRLSSGCRYISSIDVHPSGDHLIIGSLDRRMVWFDQDLGSTPYKTMKYHQQALRACAFHKRYPLMASASDDGTVHMFHCMVYNDLMRNPLIVPVKVLKDQSDNDKSASSAAAVLSAVFHPTQPWIFAGGADGRTILYQDL